jgi:hypothetical protein
MLHELAPGVLGDLPGLEEGEEGEEMEAEDDLDEEGFEPDRPPANINPNERISGKGTEAWRHPHAQDNPPEFEGMPRTGGSMVPMKYLGAQDAAYYRRFPNARRIGHCYEPEAPRSAPLTPSYRPSPVMAMDAKTNAQDFYSRFPDPRRIQHL